MDGITIPTTYRLQSPPATAPLSVVQCQPSGSLKLHCVKSHHVSALNLSIKLLLPSTGGGCASFDHGDYWILKGLERQVDESAILDMTRWE